MISYDDTKSGRAAVPATAPAVADEIGRLPVMVKAAAAKLASAATAAEVLDAKDAAALVYDASKRAGRIAKAKKAHDDVIAAAHRAQADALDIEAAAKRRLADEYDGGQERGEIATAEDTKRRGAGVPKRNAGKATAEDVGLTRKQVHDARRVRNAEKAKPGVVKEALDHAIAEGKEPTRAVVNAAVADALGETHPVDARTDAEREADAIQSPFDRASNEGRALFLARNNLALLDDDDADAEIERIERVISDAGGIGNALSAILGVDVEIVKDHSPSAAIPAVTAPVAPRPDPAGAVPLSNPRASSSRQADKAESSNSSPSASATIDRPATLAGADGHPSIPSSDALAAGPGDEPAMHAKSERAVTFNNPRCQHPDTCNHAHNKTECHDCFLAWATRPREEQVRLWAEAIAAESEAA